MFTLSTSPLQKEADHDRGSRCSLPSRPGPGRGPRAAGAKGGKAPGFFFKSLAAGFTYEQIAEASKVSVATVRRELDRAIAQWRLDAPDHYIHLQVARLTKALRLVDIRVDRGQLAAVAPLIAALDRYHRLQDAPKPAANAPLAGPPLPAPPLALTHAAPPLDAVKQRPAKVAEIGA